MLARNEWQMFGGNGDSGNVDSRRRAPSNLIESKLRQGHVCEGELERAWASHLDNDHGLEIISMRSNFSP